MANLDFGTTAVVEPNNTKVFGTADTTVRLGVGEYPLGGVTCGRSPTTHA
jgi:hypothetical protein